MFRGYFAILINADISRRAVGKLLILLSFVVLQVSVYAAGALEPIESTDRILIVSPHPDDAVLAAGGLIQEALRKKAEVKIVYITSGKHNLASLILYKKFILKRRKGALYLGKIRKEESKRATHLLGLKSSSLTFLDYPDSGILSIFKKHWKKDLPFKDSLTRAVRLAKDEGISSCSLYKGENILRDLEKVILSVKPNKIFVPSPQDRNRDHIGSYLFLRAALLDLSNKIAKPRLYLYIVHCGGLSILERYYPKRRFDLEGKGGSKQWRILKLSPDEIEKKKEAIMEFKSQMYCRRFLLSFAKDEVFKEEKDLVLNKNKLLVLHLYNRRNKPFAAAAVAIKDGLLHIDITFSKKIEANRARGVIYLIGYSRRKSFGNMPKVCLSFRGGKWNLYAHNKKMLKTENMLFEINQYLCKIQIPVCALGSPQYLFTQADMFLGLDTISMPWQIIDIKSVE